MEPAFKTHSIDSRALLEIAEGVSAETGEGFFDILVTHLARVAGTKCAWATEWFPEQRELSALSFWDDGRFITDFRYAVANTPCETVIDGDGLVHVPERLIELYPLDDDIKTLNAVSYLALPLLDSDGKVLGHLAVMDNKPMPENDTAIAILNIFAGRAAAELGRLRRERAIRDREQKLSRLFDGAMDAILELDSDLRITNLNAAAVATFGRHAADAAEKPVDEFLTEESRIKLKRLIDELSQQRESGNALWIHDGLECKGNDSTTFPAEATLSRYETDGNIYFGLILRNIRERLQTEERVRSLVGEAEYLRTEIENIQGFEDIVGVSTPLKRVLADVAKVAETDTSVLITGETGTGKELIARSIHRLSARATKPLVSVNCAAISTNLQESEFFGHERGSFTGAAQRRDGRFKLANGGTIFLDEVGEMSLDLQAKLLRVIQEGEFEPVGSSHTVRVDVRVIAATNRDLAEMVNEGSFRADLMYRLNVFPIHLPPLRERSDDIVLLAESFAYKLGKKSSRTIAPLSESMKQRLLRYDWPGNIRELQNVIERAFITSVDGKTLNIDRSLPETLPVLEQTSPARDDDAKLLTLSEIKDLERRNIERALEVSGGRISGSGGAAELLGIHANTLASRMKSLGLRQ